MEYVGLIFEFIFLIIGVYVYLFAVGRINSPNPETQRKFDRFRADNGRWLRLLSLALLAVMTINILLHVQQMIAG